MGLSAFEPPPAEAVETRTCWLWTDGRIFNGRFKLGTDCALEDAQENVRVIQRVTDGRRLPALIDLRWLRSQSAEARNHFSSPEGIRAASAVALLVESPLSRAIGNFYLGFNRPNVPTRIFNDAVAAKSWLSTFMAQAA